jgi:hypothetical protein
MKNEDWQNLRLQLKTLVDIYCELNNDVVQIKTSLKSIVKYLRKQERAWRNPQQESLKS